MHYLESLNAEQKKAVLATEGPVLIVAGAGAGKTKTITHRILHLIEKGVPAEQILAITFTNKAAAEMRERVVHLLSRPDAPWTGNRLPLLCTFHALGVQIIKSNAPLLKLPRHFSIYDTADSKKALKEALQEIGVEPKEHLDAVRHRISAEKGRGVTLSEYLERQAFDYTSELTKKAWSRYESILFRNQALDFDDLLLKTLFLLRTYPDVLARCQERFLYIHVDEYQDTNKVQNTIVEMLAARHRNLCVVGDTDQNIYSWRGAEIKNMLHFERTYPDVTTVFLEQNYRSTKTILQAADDIIKKNTYRIPKKLFTENGDGEKISLFEARSEMDEAHFVAMTSADLIAAGTPAEEIGVLYRANFQSRALEEAFLAYGVPYQMLGTKFFERKEVKDVISYVKAALNEESVAESLRIINVPARGIGKTTVEKIMAGQEETLPAGTRAKIAAFRSLLREFRTIIGTEKPSTAIKHIIERSGIDASYKTGLEEDTERLGNVMELVTFAARYDDAPGEEGMEKFLTDSALASDQDSLDNGKSGVRLMTVHASKGLEFDCVFITGLEADLFPHKGFGSDKKSGEDAEEERRLCYVAVTRARHRLFLTYAQTRTIFGTLEVHAPSEFIDDISGQLVERRGFAGTSRAPLFSIDF